MKVLGLWRWPSASDAPPAKLSVVRASAHSDSNSDHRNKGTGKLVPSRRQPRSKPSFIFGKKQPPVGPGVVSLEPLQGLVEVLDEILEVLESDRETHQAIVDSNGRSFSCAHVGVSHRYRVGDQ